MNSLHKKLFEQRKQIEDLQSRLNEAEAIIEAIRSGAADAIVVQAESGVSVFTIQGAETAYRVMVETMNEGALTVDSMGIILYTNNRFCSMINIPCQNLVGQNIVNLVSTYHKGEFERFLDRTSTSGSCYHDFDFVKKDMSILPVYLSGTMLEIPGRKDLCIIVSDLTERRIAHKKLEELNSSLEQKIKERTIELQHLAASLEQKVNHRTTQVRDLAKALSLAEQKQRQRLSVILHEDLQQTLFAVKTRFSLLKDIFESAVKDEVREEIGELTKLTSQALDTTKRLAVEFNPPVLHNEGLDAALKWLVYHITKRYGLKIDLTISDNFRIIPEDERVLVVNLTRELLINVVKHAGTGSAFVNVHRDENNIIIDVEDKGVGFDFEMEKKTARDKTHMGLFSIEERLRLFGGNIKIISQPGSGTRVTMTMPFDPEQKLLKVE